MKRSFSFIIHLMALLLLANDSLASSEEIIRLRLLKNRQELDVQGLSLSVGTKNSGIIQVAIPQNENLHIERACPADAPAQRPCFWQIIRTRGSQTFQQASFESQLVVRGSRLRSSHNLWPNTIVLSLQSPSHFDVLANLPIHQYLTGVIASEMPLSWPIEALKAQAVVARSYLLATKKERRRQEFDVEASVQDQVFQDVLEHRANDPEIVKASQVITSTEGQILENTKGHALKAFYHSDCGGQTESAKNVWSDTATTVEVKDQYCLSPYKAHWNYRISKIELFKNLKKKISEFSWAEDFEKFAVKAILRPQSFRVASLVITGLGRSLSISAPQFRQALGYSELKSTAFTIHDQGDEYLFEGQGHGHGVGLCQWGTKSWAQHGWKMEQILKHYFPLAQLSPRP